tara:strand:- start:3376 stop:5325 length:1950 start_codon:yes stop_codon:yes gene_type:complete
MITANCPLLSNWRGLDRGLIDGLSGAGLRRRCSVAARRLVFLWLLAGGLAVFSGVGEVRAQNQPTRLLAFSVLRDAAPEATIDDICCGGSQFGQTVSSLRTWYGEDPIWLKVDGLAAVDLIILNLVVDEAVAYFRSNDGSSWHSIRTGDLVAMSDRAYASPQMVLPLRDRLAGSDLYVRVHQPVLTTLQLAVQSLQALEQIDRADHLLKTFLMGILFATIVYNGFVGVFVRSPVFLLNALTICALLFLALYLSGYGVAYVWKHRPEWSNAILLATLYSGLVFGSAFMWGFLRDDGEPVRRGWPLLVPAILATPVMLCAVLLPYWMLQPVLLLCAAALFLIACAMVARRAWRGSRQARILLFPLGFAMIPGTAFVFLEKLLGVRTGLIDNNLLEVTLCLEAILFSLAIASRFRMGELAHRALSLKMMALRAEGVAKTIAAQDAERQRLAKELHDGVAQDFLVVLGSLKKLEREPETRTWKAALPSLISSTTTALNELRRISKEMHPAAISHLGLKKALEALFEHLETSSQIEVETSIDFDDGLLGMDAKLHVYRIVQECLANVSRHSGAASCKATITRKDDRLHLCVEDDGGGIEPLPISSQPSFGLGFTSIDERIRGLGGRWRLSQSSLGGVRIEASFPVTADGKAASQ